MRSQNIGFFKIFSFLHKKEAIILNKKLIEIDKRKFFDVKEATALGTTLMKVDLYKNKVIGVVNVHLSEK